MKHSIADRDVAPNVENWFSTNEQRKHNDMLDNEKIQVAQNPEDYPIMNGLNNIAAAARHQMASWGEHVELNSDFNMQEIKGEEEKEVYLIMIVHGIGSNLEHQRVREHELHAGIKKVTQGGYFNSEYQVVTHVVDWKTEVEKSFRFGQRIKRVTIPSHWKNAKDMFDYTVPDNLAYLNPRFRPRILETVTLQMNMIVTKLAREEPRFKGKVSICAHSLGSVISYDLLSR